MTTQQLKEAHLLKVMDPVITPVGVGVVRNIGNKVQVVFHSFENGPTKWFDFDQVRKQA